MHGAGDAVGLGCRGPQALEGRGCRRRRGTREAVGPGVPGAPGTLRVPAVLRAPGHRGRCGCRGSCGVPGMLRVPGCQGVRRRGHGGCREAVDPGTASGPRLPGCKGSGYRGPGVSGTRWIQGLPRVRVPGCRVEGSGCRGPRMPGTPWIAGFRRHRASEGPWNQRHRASEACPSSRVAADSRFHGTRPAPGPGVPGPRRPGRARMPACPHARMPGNQGPEQAEGTTRPPDPRSPKGPADTQAPGNPRRTPRRPRAPHTLPRPDPRPPRPVRRAHRLLALGLDPQQLDGVRTGADVDVVLADGQLTGCEVGAVRYGCGLDELEALAAEHGPRAGSRGAATHHPVHPEGRRRPIHLRVLDVDLRGEGDAVVRLRYGLEGAVLDAVHGRGEQARAKRTRAG